MSFSNPKHQIPRRSVVGHEGQRAKSFDPPKESPPTPELLNPTNATMSIPKNQRVHLIIESVWREQADHAHQTFLKMGDEPGVNDDFHENDSGSYDFFAFHDYNPDYFVVTGVNFPGRVGSTVSIRHGLTVPAGLNNGVAGMQISINAKRNQTILVRLLCAAYTKIKITFAVDVVVIAVDGRALGVPPFGCYNAPYTIPAGKPIEMSTAQRLDVLIRSSRSLSSYGQIEYRQHLQRCTPLKRKNTYCDKINEHKRVLSVF